MEKFEYIVKLAKKENISGIQAVMQENFIVPNLEEETKAQLENRGFLYSQFTLNELEQALLDSERQTITVCIHQEQVIGYAISYDFQKLKPEWVAHAQLSEKAKKILQGERGLYHRQIARKVGYPGAGEALLLAVIELSKKRGDHFILCDIAHEPLRNMPSITLHERHGFIYAGTVDKAGRVMGVYLRENI